MEYSVTWQEMHILPLYQLGNGFVLNSLGGLVSCLCEVLVYLMVGSDIWPGGLRWWWNGSREESPLPAVEFLLTIAFFGGDGHGPVLGGVVSYLKLSEISQ